MRSVTSDDEPELKEVVDGPTILEFQHLVRRIPVADHIFEYASALVRATRPDEPDAPEFVKKFMAWGAGPRASLNLILECDREMSVSDRRRWSDQKYLVGIPIPPQAGQVTDLYLTLPQMPEEDTWAVRYSPIGYPVRGEKKVVLEWPKHLNRPADDRVQLQRADGTVVKQGRFRDTVTLRHMQGDFAMFDFSDVTAPGNYRVVWARGTVDFPIRERVFEGRLWEPTLECMIPFQMCHAKVDLGDLPG